MITRLVTPPDDEPLSLAEVRMHLRNPEITSNDAELLDFIRVAREQVEHKIERALITQTWEAIFDRFPPFTDMRGNYLYRHNYLRLPYTPPLQSVTSVTYFDTSDVTQTWATSEYVVDTVAGLVRLGTDKYWPSTFGRYDAVTVRYVAGYATPDEIPANVKHYMKLLVEAMDKNRSLVQEKVMTLTPFAERMLDAHRMPGV